MSPKKARGKAEVSAEAGAENVAELLRDSSRLRALVDRAQDGDRSVLPVLRKVFDEEPKIARFMDLARDVEGAIVRRAAGDDLFTLEALPRNLKEMREEIAGNNPAAVERLLAERIVLCWLQLQYFEAIYAQSLGNMTLAQGEYQQKRIDKAHRRYLSAIKTLAQIRKLGPAVQINIAEKQINTAGSA